MPTPFTYSSIGVSGYSGYSGYSGQVGASAASGYSGISGYSGTSGYSGVSGYSGAFAGTGSSGYIPRFTGASSLGNSLIQDNGSTVTVNASTLVQGALSTLSTNGVNVFESAGISSVGLQFRTNSTNRFKIETPSASNDLAFYYGGTTEVGRFSSTGLAVTGALSSTTGNFSSTLFAGGVTTLRGANVAISNASGFLVVGSSDAAGADLGGSVGFTANTTSLANYPMGNISARLVATGAGAYASYMAFATTDGSGTVAERMRLITSGLGIGTTNPATLLHVGATSSNTMPTNSKIWVTGAGGSHATNLQNRLNLGVDTNADYGAYFGAINPDATQAYGTLGIRHAGSDTAAIYWNRSGNVGINTSSPQTKLDVAGPASVTSFTGSTALGVRITGSTSTNDYSGIDFSASTVAPRARIGAYYSNSGSYLVFGTSNSYVSGITNSALTIDYNGNVVIGATSTSSRFQVVDSGGSFGMNFVANKGVGATGSGAFGLSYVTVNYTPGSAASNIYWDGGTGWFTLSTSSRKYKRNITAVTDEQLDKALLLKPSYYQRNEHDYFEYGFIAEEVNEIGLDEFVTRVEGEISGLNYEKMVTLAIGLIKRQNTEIQSLRTRLATLESK